MTNREHALEAALRAFMKAHTHLYVSAMADDCERSAYDEAHDEASAALALPPSPQPPPVAEGDHTPGPWHINYHGGQTTDAYVWGPDGTKRGCIARVNLCGLDRDDFTARSGNARLIAAAPDMLAALQQVAAQPDNTSGDRGPIKYARHIAKCAIARATGQED